MSMGLPAYTSVGSGTLQGAAVQVNTLAVVPSANTLAGDLVILLAWLGTGSGFNVASIKDAGDGWVLFDRFNDDDYGGQVLAGCIAPRSGSAGYAGLAIGPLNDHYVLQTQTYRLSQPAFFDLGRFSVGPTFWNKNSATALDAPAINQPAQQVIDILGRSYYNAGVTTTVGAVTNFTERFDTGSATNLGGVVLNDCTVVITGAVQNPLVTSALASARGNRYGSRVMIPIIGNTTYFGRNMSSRRMLG